MLIKKLAAPLINEKLLQQAEHCYIASASVSEAGFDFIRSRIPPKCKMDMVTGLDVPTSPQVLRRIWRNYQGRITLNIYSKNVFIKRRRGCFFGHINTLKVCGVKIINFMVLNKKCF